MKLEEDAENSITAYEQALRGYAQRTREMIQKYGYVEALAKLAISADLQAGFKALRDTNQLDATFEAVILRHTNQFSKGVIEAAKWRIDNADHLR